MKKYSFDLFNYMRRVTAEVAVGSSRIGANNSIRVQSMTNTNTLDTEASVAQAIRIAQAGGELVRLTAQGIREAENLKNIHASLQAKGFNTPLVADIHFNPKVAEVAALYVEKVRINPGNFVGQTEGLDKIREKLKALLAICTSNNTAIRIGVNHGSLSERIMSEYGDTAQGMVVSAMEFLRICKEEKFDNLVISMKSSNTLVMVQSVRLLVAAMNEEGMKYPLHLGVTEAGDGEDGRVKSAVGIGALLADGIGDTIRVSLSEDPELEIPVAKKLAHYMEQRSKHTPITAKAFNGFNPFMYTRRETNAVWKIGGQQVPVVMAQAEGDYAILPDLIFNQTDRLGLQIIPLTYADLSNETLQRISTTHNAVVLLSSKNSNPVGEMRAFFHALMQANCKVPVILHCVYAENDLETLQIKAGADFGTLLLDGFGDGIYLQNEGVINNEQLNSIAFGILQASRVRVSKTEYISCPGCGRTLFDLQTTIARIKAKTAHLKGLKIGIMGCVVNGPGEMADADYGYVGAGKGKVSLYKKQVCIEKNIPEIEAVDKLIDLIKAGGDWKDAI